MPRIQPIPMEQFAPDVQAAMERILGYRRFLHALDMLGTEEPVIPFDSSQIGARRPESGQ